MAIETRIIIELKGIPATIPNVTVVTVGTKVSFILRIHHDYDRFFPFARLSNIKVYFDGLTPNGFQNSTVKDVSREVDYARNEPQRDILIAEAIVTTPGQYKFGVSATNTQGEELFDEDPYLIVYP